MALNERNMSHPRKAQPPPYTPHKKGPDDLYPFSALSFKPDDIKNTRDRILGPLSLFAPRTLEEEELIPETARPSTPVNDEIKSAPTTFDKLARHIRRRISAKPDLPHMSEDDQKELAGIIIGEVTVAWPHLRSPVDNPLISAEDNKELQRRVIVEIVDGCERLFHEHVNKLQVLNKRGIFSGVANMTRLKAQLSLKTSNLLNLSSMRRNILDELRMEKKLDNALQSDQKYKQYYPDQARFGKDMPLVYQTDFNQEIRELLSKMPTLDTSDLQSVIANLPLVQPELNEHDDVTPMSPVIQTPSHPVVTRPTDEMAQIKTQRALSMPHIGPQEKLLDELYYGQEDSIPTKVKSVTDTKVVAMLAKRAEKPKSAYKKILTPAEDLAKLMGRGEGDDQLQQLLCDEDADLPPLIRALPRNSKHDEKQSWIMKQLRELEERENARIEAETIDVREPMYVQPETVTTKVPNKMTVKTSDIRVSDRVCLSSVTLQGHQTMYNDLIDEITAEDVKKLDSNLFLGDEIREVYQEIMKTVPTDHLRLDQDDLVEPAADSVNIASTLASSTLTGKRQDRIINPDLRHTAEPPWGEHSVTSWANMPQNLGRSETAVTGEVALPTSAGVGEEGLPHMQDFMARSYASWLMWWKNTINSDDYMKYLSTQETNYLGVVFHFYNSDGEDEDEDDDESRARQQSRLQMLQERETKLAELRTQKESYEPGFWNANSVLLGGLGKDPLLGDEFLEDEKSVALTAATAPLKTNRAGTTVVPLSQLYASMQLADGEYASVRNTELDTSRGTQAGPQSARSQAVSRNTTKSKPPSGPTPQDRLEKVWAALQMPDNHRLDMAIKYSSDAYFSQLDQAISAWEEITEVINKRESVLAQLEAFERTASDPNRFFEKGPRGSSVARLDEAKMRSNLYRKIDSLDEKITGVIKVLKDDFQDEVTFKGRPYGDKLKWDRVEMLYWLQEERKQTVLDMKPPSPLAARAHLDPITPSIATAQLV